MKLQLFLTVEVDPGTTPISQLLAQLEDIVRRAAYEELFTRETDAEVNHWVVHSHVPPPDSRWADAPEWARWLAMDEDMTWCWYAHRPEPIGDEWISSIGPMQRAPGPPYPIHWQHTLEPRPKNPASTTPP